MDAGSRPRWYFNVWVVLLMLFFVVGPFGLPLVWKNPRFSRGIKWGLTLVMAAYTVWLVDLTIRMARAILAESRALQMTLPSW